MYLKAIECDVLQKKSITSSPILINILWPEVTLYILSFHNPSIPWLHIGYNSPVKEGCLCKPGYAKIERIALITVAK